MAAPSGPFYPTPELVAVAWLGQRVPGLVAGQVATTLPADVLAWADQGFVTVAAVGGAAEIDVPIRRTLVGLDFWAATAGSVKPPWNLAARLGELVRVATEGGQSYGKAVTLPAGYSACRVLAAYLVSEPRRIPGDPSGYARYTTDLALDWVRA